MMSYADPEAIGFTLILVLVEKVCEKKRGENINYYCDAEVMNAKIWKFV